jgi:PAS domain S-box-containing protein
MQVTQSREWNPKDILNSITMSIGHKLDVDHVIVYEASDIKSDKIRKFLSWKRSGDVIVHDDNEFEKKDPFLIQLINKISVNLTSWGNPSNTREIEFFSINKSSSYLASAILTEGAFWGFIICMDVRERMWVPSDLSILSDAAVEYAKYIHYSQYLNDLKKTSSDYRFIIDDVSDMVLWLDREARITNIDGRLSAISGFEKKELIGSSLMDFLYRDNSEQNEYRHSSVQAFLSNRSTSERRIKMKNGGSRWIIIKSHPLLNNGIQTGTVCLITDIDDLKHRLSLNTAALNDSKDILSEYLKDVVFVADMNLNVKYISPSDAKERGFSVEESLKQTLRDVFTPDDIRKILTLLPKTAINEAGILETRISRKDGTSFFAETIVCAEFNESGMPLSIRGIYRNIDRQKFYETRLNEVEKLYKNLSSSLTDAVLIFDNSLRAGYISPSLEAMTGYSEPELKRILKNSPFDLLGRELYPALTNALLLRLSYYKAGKKFFSENPIENYLIAKDSRRIPVEITTSGIFSAPDECSGIICSFRDISWKKNVDILAEEFSRQYGRQMHNMIGTFYLDKDYIITEADIKAVQILGIQPSDVRLLSISKIITSRSSIKFEKELAKLSQANDSTRIIELQSRYSHGKNTYLGLKVESAGYDISQNIIYRCAIADITDWTSSLLPASHIKALTDNTNDLVWFTDMSLCFTYISPSIELLLGYSREGAMSMSGDFLYTRESMQALGDAFIKGITAGKRKSPFSISMPVDMKTYNGKILPGTLKLILILGNHSTPAGFVGITSFSNTNTTASIHPKVVRIHS